MIQYLLIIISVILFLMLLGKINHTRMHEKLKEEGTPIEVIPIYNPLYDWWYGWYPYWWYPYWRGGSGGGTSWRPIRITHHYYPRSGYSGHSGYTGHTGYSGHSGYTGHTGHTGYSGHSGYTGHTGHSGYSGSYHH